MLADLLGPALAEGREAEPDLMHPIAEKMAHAHAVFRALIDRFYHRRLVPKFFFYDDPNPANRAGFISVLSGHAWRDDNARRFHADHVQPIEDAVRHAIAAMDQMAEAIHTSRMECERDD